MLARLEPLIRALCTRKALRMKQRLVREWRQALAMLAAIELIGARHKVRMCEAFAAFRMLREDAPILYAHEWKEAVERHRKQLMRGALLRLGLHHYECKEEEQEALLSHAFNCRQRCWRRWKHVHSAIQELRERHRYTHTHALTHTHSLTHSLTHSHTHTHKQTGILQRSASRLKTRFGCALQDRWLESGTCALMPHPHSKLLTHSSSIG
jgi:hypothetical protein